MIASMPDILMDTEEVSKIFASLKNEMRSDNLNLSAILQQRFGEIASPYNREESSSFWNRPEIPQPSAARKASLDINEAYEVTTIQEAKLILTIPILWDHFKLPGNPGKSCASPFRNDRHPSFSVYKNTGGEICFKDHGDFNCKGDSLDFYKLCVGPEEPHLVLSFIEMANGIQGNHPFWSSPIYNKPSVPENKIDWLAQGLEFSKKPSR